MVCRKALLSDNKQRGESKMVNRSLMCIGAHADDIEFSAGGTCLKFHDAGYSIDYVMSTNNMSGQFHIVEKDKSVTRTEIAAAKMEPLRKQEYRKFCCSKSFT